MQSLNTTSLKTRLFPLQLCLAHNFQLIMVCGIFMSILFACLWLLKWMCIWFYLKRRSGSENEIREPHTYRRFPLFRDLVVICPKPMSFILEMGRHFPSGVIRQRDTIFMEWLASSLGRLARLSAKGERGRGVGGFSISILLLSDVSSILF